MRWDCVYYIKLRAPWQGGMGFFFRKKKQEDKGMEHFELGVYRWDAGGRAKGNFWKKNWRQRQFSEVAKRHSRSPGDICLRQIRPTRHSRVITPQNFWGKGKFLSIARQFRGNFPLSVKKTPHSSSAPKVFEDSKETFCKKFFWRGPGQRPAFASPVKPKFDFLSHIPTNSANPLAKGNSLC